MKMWPTYPTAMLTILLTGSVNAHGESIDSTGFKYASGPIKMMIPIEGHEAPVIGWNVTDRRMMSPGLKIVFWGGARGCTHELRNGPVTDQIAFLPEKLGELIGLDAGPRQRLYSPSGKSPQCTADVQNSTGPSFAVIDESDKGGGIGLFTQSTGISDAHRTDFLGPFVRDQRSSPMQAGDGNDMNEGSFVTFRFDWQGESKDLVTPWFNRDSRSDGNALFSTMQSVKILDSGIVKSPQNSKGFAHLKQELIVTVLNRACLSSGKSPSKPCQVQYLFNIAVARSTVSDWRKFPGGSAGHVMFDKAQGGLPVFFGTIRSSGLSTNFEQKVNLPLWTSHCAETQHSPFRDLRICIEISRSEFANALHIATAKLTGQPVEQIDDSRVTAAFGDRWKNMEEWRVAAVTFGQEIFNSTAVATARIGGNLKVLKIETEH